MSVNNVIALDVGTERVGVAFAHADVRVPVRLTTLKRKDANFWQNLTQIISLHDAKRLVIGLPRGLDGQETDQTKSVQRFAAELAGHVELPISWQDEALTSVKAKEVLDSQGKQYEKSDVDALAASFILEDYLKAKDPVR